MKIVNDAKKAFNDLPSTWKLGITLAGGYLVFNKLKGFVGGSAERDARKAAKSDEKKFREQYEQTYADSAYTQFANMIHQAAKGAGTDNDAIYGVFQEIKNDLDFTLLTKAYGVREICALFEENPAPIFGDCPKYDLAQTISSEMNSGEKKKVNEILTNNGVSFKFF